MKAAIQNKVIAKACDFDSIRHDEDDYEGIRIGDLGIFHYEHDGEETEPYCKRNTPDIPLKADQFVADLANKIPHFQEITFKNQDSIQPMEFLWCNLYGTPVETENGYMKVTSSDNKEEYCLLPVFDQIYNLMKLGNCDRCYGREHSYLYRYDTEAYQDYPPVVIIEDYYVHDYKREHRYDDLLKNIYEKLNINKHDCFITYCAKCFAKENDLLQFFEKFQNCNKHLNTEISHLHPSLLIAVDEAVISMLKTKYEVADFSKMPCLCRITIEGKPYPLLVVHNAKTKEEQEILDSFLTEKSGEIKAILAQPRNLPPMKPRVIRIEE